MTVYSFSQISIYQQCPLKYRFKYIDDLPDDFTTGPDAVLGNAVHTSLEYLYTQVNNMKTPSFEELTQFYNDYWRDKLAELESKGETLEIKKQWLELSDYIHRWEVYLDQYYHKYHPFEDIKLIWAEEWLSFDLWDGIKFRWIIDRLDKVWDTFVINDYKTQSTLPSEQKTAHVEQLTLYWLWVSQKFWKYFSKIKARLHYLHFDIVDEWEINDELLSPIVEKYKSLIKELEFKKLEYEKWNKLAFETSKSSLCNYCNFESICPLFIHYSMEDEIVDELSEKTIRNLIDEYWEISTQIKDLEKQKEWLKELLEKYLNSKDEVMKELWWNKYKLSLRFMETYKINDKEKLTQILNQRWVLNEALEIDKTKVKSLIKEWKLTMDELVDIFIKNNSVAFISSQK